MVGWFLWRFFLGGEFVGERMDEARGGKDAEEKKELFLLA
jgi:hypothetical protein